MLAHLGESVSLSMESENQSEFAKAAFLVMEKYLHPVQLDRICVPNLKILFLFAMPLFIYKNSFNKLF